MRRLVFGVVVFLTLSAFGQTSPKTQKPVSGGLTLEAYLQSVKTGNAEVRSLVAAIEASDVQQRQADLGIMPEAYGEYNVFDDRTPPLNPGFSPDRRDGYSWKFGVRQQTNFGLGGNLYFENNQIHLGGVNPGFFPINNYTSNRGVLELRQSLWMNSFGEKTRADLNAARSAAKAELYNQKFKLKNLMLQAENTYWMMVTYNHIAQLQEENVDRAKKLNDRMTRNVRLKLFDDVESIQTEIAFEKRQLELQSTNNDRAQISRAFNTLRGVDSDQVEPLQDMPNMDNIGKIAPLAEFKLGREDFLALKEMAKAEENKARSARSGFKPKVDLVGSLASNGLDPRFNTAYDEVKDFNHPSWAVGIQVSFPLNFSLNSKLYKAAKMDTQAAMDAGHDAEFKMVRTWRELSSQQRELLDIYNKAVRIESSQSSLLSKERNRLSNGRTTTFQLLSFEQDLASAQVQRARAQLGLIQVRNLLNTFEAQ